MRGHGGASPYFTFLISQKRAARTGGPPLISILILIQTRSNLHGRRARDRGASPYFSTVSEKTKLHPAWAEARDGGASPYLSTVPPSQSYSTLRGQRTRDIGASP